MAVAEGGHQEAALQVHALHPLALLLAEPREPGGDLGAHGGDHPVTHQHLLGRLVALALPYGSGVQVEVAVAVKALRHGVLSAGGPAVGLL